MYLVDGDTITVHGKRIRLVGFDAPELGGHAHCGLKRMLAARATRYDFPRIQNLRIIVKESTIVIESSALRSSKVQHA